MSDERRSTRREVLRAGIAGISAATLSSFAQAGEARAAETGKRVRVVEIPPDAWVEAVLTWFTPAFKTISLHLPARG